MSTITVDRAVLEQALEALEEIADWHGAYGPFPENNVAWRGMAVVTARESVTALSAALAQQEQDQMLECAYKSACDIVEEQDKKLAELEAVNRELLEALRLTSIDCQYLHHARKDRHLLFEECPVVARINAAIAKAEGQA